MNIEEAKKIIIKRAEERLLELRSEFFCRSEVEEMNQLIYILKYSSL